MDLLYEGVEDYIAPEVFDRGEIDARTDVYSLGKLISYLYNSAGMPFELKPVIKKATDADPDKRYVSVEDFEAAINRAQILKRAGLLGAAALAIALTIVGLFFYTLPSPDDMEYVKPIEEPVPDEMIEEDMDALLGIGADTDSATIAQIVKQQQHMKDSLGLSEGKMREYKSKAEEIFRKQFTKAAEQIISKVYNKDQMNGSEKDFTLKAQKMTEELVAKKDEIKKSTAISADRAEAIADKIIEQLTEKKRQSWIKTITVLKNKRIIMRSRTANWFECKIRYEKVMDDGLQKKVTESYVVDALSFSEAEERIIEEMSSYISGEFDVTDIKKAAYKEIFFSDDEMADKWYKAKLQFITIDEKTEKEKRSTVTYLAQAGSFNGAVKNIEEVMGGTMIDYVIASVSETTLMDVFEYNKGNKIDDKPEYEQ